MPEPTTDRERVVAAAKALAAALEAIGRGSGSHADDVAEIIEFYGAPGRPYAAAEAITDPEALRCLAEQIREETPPRPSRPVIFDSALERCSVDPADPYTLHISTGAKP